MILSLITYPLSPNIKPILTVYYKHLACVQLQSPAFPCLIYFRKNPYINYQILKKKLKIKPSLL